MKKALVIGGAGSTGPAIIDGLLERGYKVTSLHGGKGDKCGEPLILRGLLKMPPEVEHLHADPHWTESLDEALEDRNVDLIVATYGRLKFIADAAKGHTPRLISVGGAHPIYGWMKITERYPWEFMEETPVPVKEDDPLATSPAIDNFAEQGREAERAVMQAHKEGHYNATHFRYPVIYGPRHIGPPEWPIMRRIKEGRKQIILPGGGMAIISRGFVDNLAHGIMLAVDNPEASAGQIYNICDERLVSNREWVRLIAKEMNTTLEFVEIPYSLLCRDFHDAARMTLFPYHQVMDITKIKTQLGYQDVVPFEKALELTVKWYLENPLAPDGFEEKNLGDPYDYAREDRLIQIWSEAGEQLQQQLQQVPESEARETEWRHPYAHPKKPVDLK